ncbi:MAG: diguanylate cyclase and metal dependent phosphohydrolase [Thermoleophilia bacterium]|nr:diguanylate cyclase and metal dependent phosphohydrolase [Thermoleophilia bacterium]
MWTAVETNQGTNAVDRVLRLDSLYAQARTAVATEAEADAVYRAEPSPHVRARYNHAATRLSSVLDQLSKRGEAIDRQTAAHIDTLHQQYLQLDARLFRALDRNDAVGAAAIDEAHTLALFRAVRSSVDAASGRHRAVVDSRINHLRVTSKFVSKIVPVVCSIGLLVVSLFGSIMVSYRRQAKLAADAEIARLASVAGTDNLTGLGNHRSLHEEIRSQVAAAAKRREAFAVLALDLDGLKSVNDNLGHHEGDRLIQQLADGLRATLPPGAQAYRIGGDEFIATLPGHSAIDAFTYSQHLQTTLAPPSTGILAPDADADGELDPPTYVTAGICDTTMADGDAELLLHRADHALIAAKRTCSRGLIWAADIDPLTRDSAADNEGHRRMLATALAKAVDAKDSYTRSHCETVSQLCVLIAQELGMDDADIEQLRLAGLLHDVGKIGVPDAILQKPEGLTDAEYAQMKEHSTLGHSIVAAAGLMDEALWVRHHHERVDGHGYPDALPHEQIPLPSRIIFVADAFEAITSDRPYRLGRPVAEALAELKRCAGTQFDPSCVDALVRAMESPATASWTPASGTERRLRAVPDDVITRQEAA